MSTSFMLLLSHAMAFALCLYAIIADTTGVLRYGIIKHYCAFASIVVFLIEIDRLAVHVSSYMLQPSQKQQDSFYSFLAKVIATKNAVRTKDAWLIPAELVSSILKDDNQTQECNNTSSQTPDEIAPVSSESSQSGASSVTTESGVPNAAM